MQTQSVRIDTKTDHLTFLDVVSDKVYSFRNLAVLPLIVISMISEIRFVVWFVCSGVREQVFTYDLIKSVRLVLRGGMFHKSALGRHLHLVCPVFEVLTTLQPNI